MVRFIGSAGQRIKEDYLRILRFFRFYSMFGVGEPDKKALAACAANCEGLKTLPMERIRDEFFKLLQTKNASETIKIMQENGILSYVLPDAKYMDNLAFIKKLVNGRSLENKSMLYFFVLYRPDAALAENLAQRLRFSRKGKQKFISWAEENVTLGELLDEKKRLRLAYEFDKEFCLEELLLIVAENKEPLPNFWDLYDAINAMEIPEFPLRGKDLIEQGIPDVQVGRIMKEREQAWIASDFTMTKAELLSPQYGKVSGE